tara:strand:+ start:690 stop:1079 length:390 start_codon:yes stop_codon:yes gene_type:complete
MNNLSDRERTEYIEQDPRFKRGIILFNSADWYLAHDLFEELWHETIGPQRQTIQGILQIAVAQIHLEKGNNNGAMILYGEGLGRLKAIAIPDLGIDIKALCSIVELRLKSMHKQIDPNEIEPPSLNAKL